MLMRFGIPKGQEFELDDLIGRNCVIVIKHYTNEKTGEKKDCIFYTKTSKAEPYMNTTPVGGQDSQIFQRKMRAAVLRRWACET